MLLFYIKGVFRFFHERGGMRQTKGGNHTADGRHIPSPHLEDRITILISLVNFLSRADRGDTTWIHYNRVNLNEDSYLNIQRD